MRQARQSTAPLALFALLAAGLLALSQLWHVPMMLWDHLDLVPIYQAWVAGDLAGSDFWRIHGGHMHTAAYAVLLATTWLSDGQPWLDCLVNWLLLLLYALLVSTLAARGLADRADRWRLSVVVFFALYPGHMANLQWGWQVAVFLCLCGAVGAIALLATGALSWLRNVGALGCAVLAWLGFGHGLALWPVAVMLIAMRTDLSRARRWVLASPWLASGAGIALTSHHLAAVDTAAGLDIGQVASYMLNYLGAGIARFATALAPWLAGAALLAAVAMIRRLWRESAALPWLGLLAFALIGAVLVALARAAPFGSDHAFVTRYVSFSSMFWLAWTMLALLTAAQAGARTRRGIHAALVLTVILAAGNGLHLLKQGWQLGQQTRATAETIRRSHPEVPTDVLAGIYFDQPEVAVQRLDALRELGFAPFEQ